MIDMIHKKSPSMLLLTFVTTAVTLAAALSTDVVDESSADISDPDTAGVFGTGGGNDDHDDDDDDDDDGISQYLIPHEGNSTVSATFSIHITPEHYHVVSWMFLWLCFAGAVALGMYQTRLERRWMRQVTASMLSSRSSSSKLGAGRRKQTPMGSSDPELGGGGIGGAGRKSYTRSGGGRLVRSSGRSRDKLTQSISSSSIRNSPAGEGSGDEPVVSSGDMARAKVSLRCRYRVESHLNQ